MAKYESEEGKKDSSHEPKDRKEKLTLIFKYNPRIAIIRIKYG